ncbi:MAG TPA: hypothetical protein H9844_02280 [Candidatus Evtepia faecigallinarum]|nr:hypothetical protein [Candidatus Evtepia faecigallinarum]
MAIKKSLREVLSHLIAIINFLVCQAHAVPDGGVDNNAFYYILVRGQLFVPRI